MIKSFNALLFSILVLAGLFTAPLAQAAGIELIQKGQDVTLSDQKAYILVRNLEVTNRFPGAPILVRRLTKTEKSDYETAKRAAYDAKEQELPYERFSPDYKGTSNTYFFNARKTYEKEDKTRIWLAEVPAGTYVVYAQAYGASGGACMCMGSVEFTAKAGTITDMGYFNADLIDPRKKPSSLPWVNEIAEDRDEYKAGLAVIAAKITPHNEAMLIPEKLAGLKREPAQYKAAGKMPNFMSMMIMRLEPMEGVLAYEEDIIIDVRTGRKLR